MKKLFAVLAGASAIAGALFCLKKINEKKGFCYSEEFDEDDEIICEAIPESGEEDTPEETTAE